MTTWTLIRDETVEESNLYDVQTNKSVNPFGDYAVCKIDDVNGTKRNDYGFGTRIDLIANDLPEEDLSIDDTETFSVVDGTTETIAGTVDNAGTFSNKGTVSNQTGYQDFTGFVVSAEAVDAQGSDKLEVEAYTFDQFLRKNDVTNDQSGKPISEAIKDIVETDTPVTYVPGNVNVQDDQRLTLSLKDETVEEALRRLSFKSAGETFGVNGDLEFFFRPSEREHNQRGIDNSQWFDYDIPERGREAINEVEVRFDGGNRSVVVDDGVAKLNIEESLNLPGPAQQRARINRPEITEVVDAEDEGQRYLELRNATLTGEVTTYGLFDLDPFDTIDIEVTDAGIDDEFVVTSVKKDWGRDETVVSIVEKRGFDDATIARLESKTERLDLRDSDPDATEDRIISTDVAASVSTIASYSGNSSQTVKTVNDGRNLIRDGWGGDGNLNITDIAIGTDGSNLSRSNSSLGNEVARGSVSETFPDSTSVEYSAGFITNRSIQEIGLFDSNNTLIARSVFDSPISSNGTATVSLTVDDSNTPRGVVTSAGQTAIRDIIADNNPKLPTQFAFGSGTSEPAVSDASLENQILTTDLEKIQINGVDTQTDWENYIVNAIQESEPIQLSNGILQTQQTCFHRAVRDFDNQNIVSGGSINTFFDSDAARFDPDNSSGTYVNFSGVGTFFEYDIVPNHNIANSDLRLFYRVRNPTTNSADAQEVSVYLNDTLIEENIFTSQTAGSFVYEVEDPGSPGWGFTQDLKQGDTYTLKFEVTAQQSGDDLIDVNCWAFGDNSYNITIDNTLDADNILDSPETHPDLIEREFAEISTRRDVDTATVESQWVDDAVGQNQFIELSNDGGSNYIRTNNNQTATADFSQLSRNVKARAGLSRYIGDSDTTPKFDSGQGINVWDLFANPDAVIPDGIAAAETRGLEDAARIQGQFVQEVGQLADDNSLLTRSIFSEIEITSQIANITGSETVRFEQ
jgi:hypothetical protein